jgi:hypothetical protein
MALSSTSKPSASRQLGAFHPGAFVISLDFELDWGRGEQTSPSGYELRSYLGERDAIMSMPALFEQHEIAATWATVGCLFAETKSEREKFAPQKKPRYRNTQLNPYAKKTGESEADDPLHYAGTVIRQIAACPRQEIATHTF